MRKDIWTLTAPPSSRPLRLARWGHYGTPVLVFPSAGADCLEVERFGLIEAAAELIASGRAKLYSLDAGAAHCWLAHAAGVAERVRMLRAFDARIAAEVVPQIRRDCQSASIEIVTAGTALGAYTALASLCADPDSFRAALALSGVFEQLGYLRGPLESSVRPAARLPELAALIDAAPLRLSSRRALFAAGRGDYENPGETERAAAALNARGVATRLELWGLEHAHGWRTWRQMLPRYLAELV